MSKAHAAVGQRPKMHSFKILGRLLRYLFHYYKGRMIAVFVCIAVTAAAGISSSVFMNLILEQVITPLVGTASTPPVPWSEVADNVFYIIGGMGLMYIVALGVSVFYNQTMAIVTQGFLRHVRDDMFGEMQSLPIRYFDTHTHGDIMSVYTNDTDALRQLVSMSIPQVFYSIVAAVTLLVIMLLKSIWLLLVVLLGVVIMALVAKFVGGRSARHFIRQQDILGKTEGYIEEMMGGQKVIKVFCHEEQAKQDFDKINDELCDASDKANAYGNILMPAVMNIGHFMFVVTAIVAGLFILFNVQNFTVTGWGEVFSVEMVGLVAVFLNMSRQFSLNIGQVSMQINSVVMGLAGAGRIFELLDEKPEADDGYVTLVNANIAEDGTITESAERTGKWAWRHPHQADGTVTYTELKGDIRLFDVDFGYVPEKIVLHNVSIYAKPGQKIAFVGATGAGKTTITNLLNRFYDIADGKIRYDGININKIKKADLRRSMGIVLQDTNLFTGTIMENIRYGKLDATDEECIEAAKLANAHDFITRLPEGYNTVLRHEASNLSQGQRQLISIARAAVADPPVMILDEATSSIDTRTEALVQKGMDALMKGRTVFVIAHRLSTIQNSDAIMVLDHGRIIERGSHEQLIAQKGTYYQLYTGAFELE